MISATRKERETPNNKFGRMPRSRCHGTSFFVDYLNTRSTVYTLSVGISFSRILRVCWRIRSCSQGNLPSNGLAMLVGMLGESNAIRFDRRRAYQVPSLAFSSALIMSVLDIIPTTRLGLALSTMGILPKPVRRIRSKTS